MLQLQVDKGTTDMAKVAGRGWRGDTTLTCSAPENDVKAQLRRHFVTFRATNSVLALKHACKLPLKSLTIFFSRPSITLPPPSPFLRCVVTETRAVRWNKKKATFQCVLSSVKFRYGSWLPDKRLGEKNAPVTNRRLPEPSANHNACPALLTHLSQWG